MCTAQKRSSELPDGGRVDGNWAGIWRMMLTNCPLCSDHPGTVSLVQWLGAEVGRHQNSEGWCSRTSSVTNKLHDLGQEHESPTGGIP